jgi:tetratricopeptide (TPR) repeat protein
MPKPILVSAIIAAGILAAFLGPPVRADDKWIEVRSAHFTVYTPASEKEGRKIADQFEQIRALFHAALPGLRIDTPQPILILAVKNEKAMKEMMPEDWEVKGHAHPAGLYQKGLDKDYIVMQLDTPGANPYHVLYHEYTHALMHLNFTNLPVWFDEGIAEYLGNSIIGDKESQIGTIDPNNLYILQQNKLLPIETLLGVDHTSPYYNESNRTSVFYAESWAVVHYLSLSPEARQKQLLTHFLQAWSTTHNQLEAARQAFGDLKKFAQIIDSYVQQGNFYHGVVKNSTDAVAQQSTSGSVSPAMVVALRGDFFVHHNRLDAGKPLLDQAAQMEPALAFAHAGLAYYYYRKQDMASAQKEAHEAIRLGDKGFFPPYLEAVSMLRGGIAPGSASGKDSLEQVAVLLEQSKKLNPNFAPTFEAFANLYSMYPDKQKAAVGAAIQAVTLDPGELGYAMHLTTLLLNNNRDAEAKIMANRIMANAETPAERHMAETMVQRVADHHPVPGGAVGNASGITGSVTPGTVIYVKPDSNSDPNRPVYKATIGIEGELVDVNCDNSPQISMGFRQGSGEPAYFLFNLTSITIVGPGNASAPDCKEWNGRKVTVGFTGQQNGDQPAQIAKVVFH